MKYVGVGIVTLLISPKYYIYFSDFADLINLSFGSTSVVVRICDTLPRNRAGQRMPMYCGLRADSVFDTLSRLFA